MVDILSVSMSNKWKYVVGNKQVDLATDDFKLMFMAQGYVFDRDAHDYYTDIESDELESGNGYVKLNDPSYTTELDLTGGSYVEDSTYNLSKRTFSTFSLSVSGGDVGPFKNIVLIDWSVSQVVAGCITLENNVLIPNPSSPLADTFELSNIELQIA